jgi:hypothetical protein
MCAGADPLIGEIRRTGVRLLQGGKGRATVPRSFYPWLLNGTTLGERALKGRKSAARGVTPGNREYEIPPLLSPCNHLKK